MTLSIKATEILASLRSNVESKIDRWDGTWGAVYLDNAKPRDISPRQFAGYLSALEKAGLYIPIGEDHCFGDVKLD